MPQEPLDGSTRLLYNAIAADTTDFAGHKIILTRFGCMDDQGGGCSAKADYPGCSIYSFIGGNTWTSSKSPTKRKAQHHARHLQ